MKRKIVFGEEKLKIEDIVEIAFGRSEVALSEKDFFRNRILKGAQFLEALLKADGNIYGVTTGFGDSCTVEVDRELAMDLPLQLVRFHQCGLGQFFSPEVGRAVQATRLASLSNGMSGVRLELLNTLVQHMNSGIAPRIPEEGSVGASGDLTPLAYLAASLIGESEVYFRGEVCKTKDALEKTEIEPVVLKPKEGLALMNGTAVMTALACLAFQRAEYVCRAAARMTSLATIALKGNAFHFDEVLFSAKPHMGQNEIAQWIREDLDSEDAPKNSNRLQDRYSIRCAPHVIGVLQDALPFFRQIIETELNSTNDNPVIDGEAERVLHGGHFYGGHIAFVMDSMKTLIANVADLVDRQMALLMDPKFNNGLPANLSGKTGHGRSIHHGFKAVQIGVSAWTAEALKQTMPASVFSRSTECHNQDKVSMGTIAARDCMRVLQLTEQVLAAGLLAATQGVEIRKSQGELMDSQLNPKLRDFMTEIRSEHPFLTEDRPMDNTLREMVGGLQSQKWELYS